jgi:hypothetical protein
VTGENLMPLIEELNWMRVVSFRRDHTKDSVISSRLRISLTEKGQGPNLSNTFIGPSRNFLVDAVTFSDDLDRSVFMMESGPSPEATGLD